MQTALGPIEFKEMGEGIPLLIIHGTPGGYDQAAALAAPGHIFEHDFHVIAPSRPGYLRTPLSSGESPEAQARLFAALLDSLHLDQVAVMGISGGGPSALSFARLFPERTLSLELVVALTKAREPEEEPWRTKVFDRVTGRDFSIYLLSLLVAKVPDLDPSDPVMVSRLHHLIGTMLPYSQRQAGWENDSKWFTTKEGWPIDGIIAPTLFVAGTRDAHGTVEHAEYAMAKIPGAQLIKIDGDHLMVITHAAEVWTPVVEFIRRHAKPPPT
jgi:pimeloyl-ACP methyl ester carboxylesterase